MKSKDRFTMISPVQATTPGLTPILMSNSVFIPRKGKNVEFTANTSETNDGLVSSKTSSPTKTLKNKDNRRMSGFGIDPHPMQLIYKKEAEIAKRNSSRIRRALVINKFLILPDDKFKDFWGIVVTLILLYSSIITPYKIAFLSKQSIGWMVTDIIIDLLFLADLMLNFFMAYFDEEEEIVTDRRKIVKNYLRSWFILDLVALLPFNYLMQDNGKKDYSQLARLSRLPRLYRLIKITKILRTIRLFRDRQAVRQQKDRTFVVEKCMRISKYAERFATFSLLFFILVHVNACLFYLLPNIIGIYPDSWVVKYGYQDSQNYEIYTASFYYTITTITTVGYGDISPQTTSERWFSTFLMVIGVMSYSFAISSMSSYLASSDKKAKKVKQDLKTLDTIDLEYSLNNDIYLRLRKFIILRNRNEEYLKDHQEFINQFPRRIKRKMNIILHGKNLRRINIFQTMNDEFVEAVAAQIRVKKVTRDEYIYKEGDLLDGIYFLAKGRAEMVLPEYHDRAFFHIAAGHSFGELDFLEEEQTRRFTIMAAEDCDLLFLNKGALCRLMEKYDREVMRFFLSADYKMNILKETKEKMVRRYEKKTSVLSRKLIDAITKAKSLAASKPDYFGTPKRTLGADDSFFTVTASEGSFLTSEDSEEEKKSINSSNPVSPEISKTVKKNLFQRKESSSTEKIRSNIQSFKGSIRSSDSSPPKWHRSNKKRFNVSEGMDKDLHTEGNLDEKLDLEEGINPEMKVGKGVDKKKKKKRKFKEQQKLVVNLFSSIFGKALKRVEEEKKEKTRSEGNSLSDVKEQHLEDSPSSMQKKQKRISTDFTSIKVVKQARLPPLWNLERRAIDKDIPGLSNLHKLGTSLIDSFKSENVEIENDSI